MAITPTLADGESFVAGRSIAKARELVLAAEAAGLPGTVRTASHGYIVPTAILEADATDADDDVELFDPAKSTVDEVREYLEDADDDEFARVIAAERAAAKPRKGILDLAAPEGE